MISVTKCFDFCYGHRLPGYDGKCANVHGHNSKVEVEIARNTPHTIIEGVYPGMVLDFSTIKEIVKPIIDDLDHKFLNNHEEFADYCRSLKQEKPMTPTAEVITMYLASKILKALPTGLRLLRLRVSETDDSFAEWKNR